MNNWITALNAIVKNFTEEEHEVHKKYFQKQLHRLLLQSPFIRRCVEKPVGYSGDNITLDMIYNNVYDGDTLLGKLVSKYTYNIDASRAVKLRKECIKNIIFDKISTFRCDNRRMKVFSVGCGSAREVAEIVKTNGKKVDCDFFGGCSGGRPTLRARRHHHSKRFQQRRNTCRAS